MSKTIKKIRLVSEEGELSFRMCIMDEEDDVLSISSERYFPKASSPKDMSLVLHYLNEASRLPILITKGKKKGGWTDDNNTVPQHFSDILGDENE